MLPAEFWSDLAAVLENAIRGLLMLMVFGWTPLTVIALGREWLRRRRTAAAVASASRRWLSVRVRPS